MFGSGVLDTAIGVVFVFLLVSMLVTIANEIISAVLLSRAKWLRIGIDRLLGPEWAEQLYQHPLISGSAPVAGAKSPGRWNMRGSGPSYIPSRSFANVLLDLVRRGDATIQAAQEKLKAALDGAVDPASAENLKNSVIAAAEEMRQSAVIGTALAEDLRRQLNKLSAGSLDRAKLTADIQRFIDGMPARYLREVIRKLPNEQVSKTLLVLLDDAENDSEKFKSNIEIWFNNAMDRVGGWYKRRSQWVIAGLSLAVAVAMNVDAIVVVKHLDTHPGVRDALVAQARAYAASSPAPGVRPPASAAPGGSAASGEATVQVNPRPDAQFSAVEARLMELSLPIGWVRVKPTRSEIENRQFLPGSDWPAWRDTIFFHFLGWLLTALAATLGAPFWFDTLNRFMSIRSAGKAPEENPKPPKDVPTPLEPGQSPREADLAGSAKRT